MYKRTITLVCCLLFSASLTFAQATKAEATDFGISIIQSFFDRDCDYMFDNLDASITSIEGSQTIAITPDKRKLFCSEPALRPDIQVTYQMYTENYAPKVYNKTELVQAHPKWAANLNLQAGDYFFDGGHPIAAGHTRLFKTESMARFVLRKINGDWKIIAI